MELARRKLVRNRGRGVRVVQTTENSKIDICWVTTINKLIRILLAMVLDGSRLRTREVVCKASTQ
jgi:hypothetical protein